MEEEEEGRDVNRITLHIMGVGGMEGGGEEEYISVDVAVGVEGEGEEMEEEEEKKRK